MIAWQMARKLNRQIYTITRCEPFIKDYGLAGQIQRASVSVMANIAEGFERAGQLEFRRFLLTAKASCAEVRSHLYVAFDVGYINQEVFKELMALTEEVGRVLGGLRLSVERRHASNLQKK